MSDDKEKTEETEGESTAPKNVFSRAAQKILAIIQTQLKNDNLYSEKIVASLKRAIPGIKKIAQDGDRKFDSLTVQALVENEEKIKKEISDKEAKHHRKDFFTRFLLIPFEKFISMGDSMDVSPEKIPRKIIPVIKETIEMMVPAGFLEQSKKISEQIVELYPDSEQTGIDWEAVKADWDIVLESVLSCTKGENPVNWNSVHSQWKADFKEKEKLEKLKRIGALHKENIEIFKKLVYELTNTESAEHQQIKLKEHLLDHIYKETGHEPDEAELERMCNSLIQVLSKPLA